MSPLFIKMIKQAHIKQLIEEHLEGSNLFLVRLSIGKDNLINVFIDGDKGVTIAECVSMSRYIEQNLDRETEDFELRVSSPGVDEPFVNKRQYKKNIGRPVLLKLKNGIEKRGILESVDVNHITLREEIKSKQKKNKKMITGESIQIQMDEIIEAKVIIIF